MRVMNASEVEAALETEALVEQLRQMFRAGASVPPRHHHTVNVPDGADATLLLMPAWQEGRYMGVKIVTVFPDNAGQEPAVGDGRLCAAVGAHRRAARHDRRAHADLAPHRLRLGARRQVPRALGRLAPADGRHRRAGPAPDPGARAGAADQGGADLGPQPARRSASRATSTSRRLKAQATSDLEGAVRGADVISCATLSQEPLVRGEWLREGAHLDLVGGFTPEMREADDAAIDRARVFVDTYAGAFKEAGDIVQPIRSGLITEKSIAGDLAELTQGRVAGRRFHNQITLFKSVGTAIEDLAGAILVFETMLGGSLELGPNTGVLRG